MIKLKNQKPPFWLWLLLALASILFLLIGMLNITGTGRQLDRFERAGYSLKLYYLIAALEILGAIGLWIEKTQMRAALLLIVITLASLYTHLTLHEYNNIFVPVACCSILSMLFIHRDVKLFEQLQH